MLGMAVADFGSEAEARRPPKLSQPPHDSYKPCHHKLIGVSFAISSAHTASVCAFQ
jgi:hypothetical protein